MVINLVNNSVNHQQGNLMNLLFFWVSLFVTNLSSNLVTNFVHYVNTMKQFNPIRPGLLEHIQIYPELSQVSFTITYHSVYTTIVFLQENMSQDTSFCETTTKMIIDYGYISQRTQTSVSFLFQQSNSQCCVYHNRIVTKIFKHSYWYKELKPNAKTALYSQQHYTCHMKLEKSVKQHQEKCSLS